MDLNGDLSVIRGVACCDKAMISVPGKAQRAAFDAIEAALDARDKDAFLLDAMHLFALAGNGHTRLIPNSGIDVFPLRLVWAGNRLWDCTKAPRSVETIGGLDVDRIFSNLSRYLAGTEPRQKVIGALPLIWPAALERLGIGSGGSLVRYAFHDGTQAEFRPEQTVPAHLLYPTGENGWPDPTVDPYRSRSSPIPVIRLNSLVDDPPGAVETRIEYASHVIRHASSRQVILDLRGNPGGDFIRHLPILDLIGQIDLAKPPAILVDRFTFSAAIVLAALCRGRFAATIVGEEMGDRGAFFAEGGTVGLPSSRAAIRWSDGFHDWENGMATSDTPPEIASEMRACGSLLPDLVAVTSPEDLYLGNDPALDVACSCYQ